MNTKEKIRQYLDYKGKNANQFYSETGLSNGFLHSGKYAGSDKVRIIIETYPDLNLEWLIMDKGEMIIINKEYGFELDDKIDSTSNKEGIYGNAKGCENRFASMDQKLDRLRLQFNNDQLLMRDYPAIVITDNAGHVISVNDSFTRQTGYSKEEAKTKKIGDLLQHDDFSHSEKRRLRSLLNAGAPFTTSIHPNYTKDGHKLRCNIVMHPILIVGKIDGFIAFANYVLID